MQLKHVLLAALCVAMAYSLTAKPACVAGDGKFVKLGICQHCDLSCKTCTGPKATDCVTCTAPETIQTGECKCPAGEYIFGADLAVIACAATGVQAADKCPSAAGFTWDNTTKCTRLPNPYCVKYHTDGVSTTCLAGANNCWGAQTAAVDKSCPYADNKTFVSGNTTQTWDKGADTLDGHFLNTGTKGWERLPLGCKVGTTATTCTTCGGTGFTVMTDASKGCECKAGSWIDTTGLICAVNTVANCDVQATTDTCTTCKATFVIDSTKKICAAATVTASATVTGTVTGTVDADAPPTDSGCDATFWGCSKCDSTTKANCTTCNDAKNWMLDGTKCKCKADYVGSTTDNKDCGYKCATSCVKPQVATLASGACKCDAATTTAAVTTTSGMLLTVASMVMAVILA